MAQTAADMAGAPASAAADAHPTFASFAPTNSSGDARSRRQAVLLDQKSPLLLATPPTVTRALVCSHPFILPLSHLFGLISWSSGDPWSSCLVVLAYWALVLYADLALQWAGPLVIAVAITTGMYARRYSPLSTNAATQEAVQGHARKASDGGRSRHQKSLDDIVESLMLFTNRCHLLLDPLLRLTDMLASPRTATSSTTRPALTALYIRLAIILPIWMILAAPPFRIITVPRVLLVGGTIALTWHARPAKVVRALLWRSLTVRWILSLVTGFELLQSPRFEASESHAVAPDPKSPMQPMKISSAPTRGSVRFTFVVYENQRRWLGLGWTTTLFAYERTTWTDEQLRPSPPKEELKLPVVEGAGAAWRWLPGSEWKVEAVGGNSGATGRGKSDGWIYYDNKWNDGRTQDGWGRYTRRRKWYRDAELVDGLKSSDQITESSSSATPSAKQEDAVAGSAGKDDSSTSGRDVVEMADTSSSTARRRGFFRREDRKSEPSSDVSQRSRVSDEEVEHHDGRTPRETEHGMSFSDDLKMGLG